ncbi:MAG: peptidylprolyl isomerase [Candidatus Paceibacterota bacterium]
MNRVITALIVVIFVILGYVGYMEMRPDAPKEVSTQENESLFIAEGSELTTNTDTKEIMNTTNTITLQTAKGDITLELYPDLAPNTVANFKKLASADFYDGVIFHRVIEGFMIQGGDPTGTGTGGPGYTFEDELKPSHPEAQKGYVRGTLAMANAGPDTNGSQFFIVHQDAPLPYDYTIFGRVTGGMEVVDAIASVETNGADKPLEDIVISDVIIEE